jgi:hypothetical protein
VLAELQHPGIARHVAHGATEDGRHYLAMEWLDGEDLAARLRRGPLGVEDSLLHDGSVAAMVVGANAPTDLAASAARCALALWPLLPDPRMALATGWDVVDGTQPVGQVIDRAAALLSARADRPGPMERAILLDPMTRVLLGPHFEVSHDAHGPVLVSEREPLEDVRTLLGRPTPFVGRDPEPKFAAEVEYVFQHGLVRKAAYSMLTEADRRLGHRLAGIWLEEVGECEAAVLAEHFERGEAIGAAAQWYERAAER